LLTKWKLCEEKNHFGVAKPRIYTIPKTKLVKNKYMTSKYQVCVRVQQNILNAETKRDKIFVDLVETL